MTGLGQVEKRLRRPLDGCERSRQPARFVGVERRYPRDLLQKANLKLAVAAAGARRGRSVLSYPAKKLLNEPSEFSFAGFGLIVLLIHGQLLAVRPVLPQPT